MSLARKVPAAAASIAAVALLVIPASAETPNSPQAGTSPTIASNIAQGGGNTMAMAKQTPPPTIGTSTTTQTAGTATGTDLTPKTANKLQ